MPAILAAFDLGSDGRLSEGPTARGRLGADGDRRYNEGWVREYLDRPLTRRQTEALLES